MPCLIVIAQARASYDVRVVSLTELATSPRNYFPKPRIGDIDFKVNAGFRIEDWTTPTAMLSRGRR
jgi:hypothetical protein